MARVTPAFISTLDHFEAEHTGPYGKIISNWKRKGKSVQYHVVIPANSTATVVFPAGKKVSLDGKEVTMTNSLQITAGSYDFIVK